MQEVYSKIWMFTFFLLASCGLRCPNVEDLTIPKQRQKISYLQKKLQLAEKEQKKLQIQIERLSDEAREAELAFIRKQIDHFEETIRKNPNKKSDFKSGELFLDEREKLHTMILKSESPYEAQVTLDRIFQLITDLDSYESN